MKTTIFKNKLFLGLGVALAVSAPIAIVVACGESDTPAPATPTTPTTPETPVTPVTPTLDAAAQSIISAPDEAPANANLSTRILVGLKKSVTTIAGSTPLTTYLQGNRPDFSGSGATNYADVLFPEFKRAYNLPSSTTFDFTTFGIVVTRLGIDINLFYSNALTPGLANYDGTQTSATTSWAALIKFWNYILTPDNNYSNLARFLKTGDVITEAKLLDFDTVLSTPLGQNSTVKSLAQNETDRFIVGFGGQPLFAKSIVVTPADYQVRSETEIRKAITNPDSMNPVIDLEKLNNVFEVNLAVAYVLKIKDATSRPIASFWRQSEWGAYADQLAKVNYDTNINFKYGTKTETVPSSDFSAARDATNELITALRSTTATPQVTFEPADYTPAATAPLGEDTLNADGLEKVLTIGSQLTREPIVQALLTAHPSYATNVLSTLASISADQFTAYGKLLRGLNTGLESVFSKVTSAIGSADGYTKFRRSYAINLFDLTKFTGDFDKSTIKDNGLANFMLQAFTKQYDGATYVVADATPPATETPATGTPSTGTPASGA